MAKHSSGGTQERRTIFVRSTCLDVFAVPTTLLLSSSLQWKLRVIGETCLSIGLQFESCIAETIASLLINMEDLLEQPPKSS